jgi:hypothetical protein
MATMGTPDYAAPEQQTGTADHRADIYSLGVVLYEMLTGERPKEHITPPSKHVQVDIRIDEIVLRALEKSPEMRFATAAEFRTQVEAVSESKTAKDRDASLVGAPTTSPVPTVALCSIWWFAIFIVLFFIVEHLPIVNPGIVAVAVMMLIAPLLRLVLLPAGRPLIQITSVLGWTLALPLAGFAVFFFAQGNFEHPGWHPSVEEAITTVLAVVGSFVLPWASLSLGHALMASAPKAARQELPHWAAIVACLAVVASLAFGWPFVLPQVPHDVHVAWLKGQLAALSGKKVADASSIEDKTVNKPGSSPQTVRTQVPDTSSSTSPAVLRSSAWQIPLWKLWRKGEQVEGASPSPSQLTDLRKLSTSALLAKPPELGYLAWQMTDLDAEPMLHRFPDGKVVSGTEANELLQRVGRVKCDDSNADVRFHYLHLWLNHPIFESGSLLDLTLSPSDGGETASAMAGSKTAFFKDKTWMSATRAVGLIGTPAQRVNIRLRYVIGPLTDMRDCDVVPGDTPFMSLYGGSQIGGFSQTEGGRALVTIGVNMAGMGNKHFSIDAILKDSREIIASEGRFLPRTPNGVGTMRFEFNTPLSEVRKFRIGVRDIQTKEWRNVLLPPLAQEAPVSGTSSQPKVSDPSTSFGPIIERVMSNDSLLDLDTGAQDTYAAIPQYPDPKNEPDQQRVAAMFDQVLALRSSHLEKQRMDVLFNDGAVWPFAMTTVFILEQRWNELEASELPTILRIAERTHPSDTFFNNGRPAPRTYAFRTREGGMGLLQVINPVHADGTAIPPPKASSGGPVQVMPKAHGVTIRYKLIQEAAVLGTPSVKGTEGEDLAKKAILEIARVDLERIKALHAANKATGLELQKAEAQVKWSEAMLVGDYVLAAEIRRDEALAMVKFHEALAAENRADGVDIVEAQQALIKAENALRQAQAGVVTQALQEKPMSGTSSAPLDERTNRQGKVTDNLQHPITNQLPKNPPPAPPKVIQRKVEQLQNDVPLKDPPQLRYIAWHTVKREEWQLYTPSGEKVAAPGDVPKEAWDWWMQSNERRANRTKATEKINYLTFIYSHPAIDNRSETRVDLFKPTGEGIEMEQWTSIHEDPKRPGELGWFSVGCLVPVALAGETITAKIKLSGGTWRIGKPVAVGEVNSGSIGTVMFSNSGEGADHRAFVTVVTLDEDVRKLPQWEVLGKLKEDSVVSQDRSTAVHFQDQWVHTITFLQPLAEFESFYIRHREPKTFTFENIKVPPIERK